MTKRTLRMTDTHQAGALAGLYGAKAAVQSKETGAVKAGPGKHLAKSKTGEILLQAVKLGHNVQTVVAGE